MVPARRIAASFLTAVFLAGALAGQAQRPDELILLAHAFKYRRAGDALALVSPLLSQRGTVELQPGSNTLVIRDTPSIIKRVIPVLRTYDQPARALAMELYIVRASRSPVSPAVPRSNLPETLTRRLRSLLAYDSFEVQAQALLNTWEGQSVTYALAEDYEVSFRLGTISADQQVKLSDFRALRRDHRLAVPLLSYSLVNLRLDQPQTLGLAKSESSPEALMFVLILRNGARRLQKEP